MSAENEEALRVGRPEVSPLSKSVVESIISHAFSNCSNVAVYDGTTRLTYAELVAWSAALAVEIEALSDRAAPIGIFLPNGTAYVVAILALLIAGRPSVPMDPGHPNERNRRIIDRAGLAAVIIDSDGAKAMQEIDSALRQVFVSPASRTAALPRPPRPAVSSDRIVMINFTSGSTGEPKGVCRAEKSLTYHVEGFDSKLTFEPNDRVPILGSISAVSDMNLVTNSLSAGAQIGIFDLKRIGLSGARQQLEKFRPTICWMVPGMFRALFEPDDTVTADIVRDVRWIRLGADSAHHYDVALFRRRFPETCELAIGIGATEVGVYASWCIDRATIFDRPLVPVGYPAGGVDLDIIDEDGAEVPRGEIGEIFVTGPKLAISYWRDEALTGLRFGPSTTLPGKVRYQTGDYGRFLPNGLLEFVGRRDRQVKIRGNTVHLGEIEAVLASCPGVAEVGVVARQSADGLVLVAYCTPAAGRTVAEEQLRIWCRDRLPAPMRPTYFFVPETLPRLPGGKLDLVELASLDAQQAFSSAAAAAAETEAKSDPAGIVRQGWIAVLSADSFDTDTAFEAAGGNSLKGLELVMRLETLLGRSLEIGTLDLDTRPSELIRRLSETSSVQSAADDAAPFIVFFPGMWGDDVGASDFYRRLTQRFRVISIDHRLGGDALAADYGAGRYFDAAIAAIGRFGPPRRLWLVGYCYGGKLAAEIGRRLLASGMAVEAIISLDGEAGTSLRRLNAAEQTRPWGLQARVRASLAAHGSVGRYIFHGIAIRLARLAQWLHADRVLPRLLAVVRRFGSAASYRIISRTIVARTRIDAFGDLPGGTLPMPLWLFVSDDPWHDRSRPDLGWEGRCQEVRRIAVGGTHLTMLLPPTRDRVIDGLVQLESALRTQPAAGRQLVADSG